MTSSDLAMQVASAVGFDRLIPASDGVPDIAKAVHNLHSGLTVTALQGNQHYSGFLQKSQPRAFHSCSEGTR